MMEEARLEYLMEKEVPDTGAIELLQVDDDDWGEMKVDLMFSINCDA